MGKRGKRRKRFFTTSRTKRSAAKLAAIAKANCLSEEQINEETTEDTVDLVEGKDDELIVSQANSNFEFPINEEYGTENAIIVRQVIPRNMEMPVSSGNGTNNAKPSTMQYSLCPSDNLNNKSTNSRIVYITPKRVLEHEDHLSFNQVNKRIRIETQAVLSINMLPKHRTVQENLRTQVIVKTLIRNTILY